MHIEGRTNLSLKFISRKSGLPIADVRSISQGSLRTWLPNELPPETPVEKKQRMESMLGGKNKKEVMRGIEVLTDFNDKEFSDRYNELEALLFLYPELGSEMIEHIEASLYEENFDVQLSLIFGALSTMDAKNIEDDVLNFAYRHQHDVNISHQAAFALADMSHTSENARVYLEELSHSNDTEIKNIGILSLGAIGRQNQHQDTVRENLYQGLLQATEEEQVHYIAAMANANDPKNLDLFRQTIGAENPHLASEAVIALRGIPGNDSFNLIQKVIESDPRESVVHQGLLALTGHLSEPKSFDIIRSVVSRPSGSDSLRLQALGLLQTVAVNEPAARAYLMDVRESQKFSPDLRSRAHEILLTL